MAAAREIEGILREAGVAHQGVVSRKELVARGIASHVIDRMLRSGRLAAVRRGVYQIGPLPQERSAEASAVLRCGPSSRISHFSAAAIHGIRAVIAGDAVEVTMPRNRRCRAPGIRVHRVRDLRPDEVTTLHGIPITTPARTLLDIAETLSARQVEQALAKALRMGLVTPDEMRDMVERHPRHRGAPLLRRLLAVEDGPAFTRSEAEERLLLLIREAGLPAPELNALVLGHEVDFLWRTMRVIAEVDGYAFHNSLRSFAADRRRDAEMAAAGYRVLRFTWADVTEARLATVGRLAQALAR